MKNFFLQSLGDIHYAVYRKESFGIQDMMSFMFAAAVGSSNLL